MSIRIAVFSTMKGFAWGGSEELWAAVVETALHNNHQVAVSVDEVQRDAPRNLRLAELGARFSFRKRPFARVSGRMDRVWSRFSKPLKNLMAFDPDIWCVSLGSAFDLAFDAALFDEFRRAVRSGQVPYVLIVQLNVDSRPSERFRTRQVELVNGAARVAFVSDKNHRALERQLCTHIENSMLVRNPLNLATLDVVPWPARSQAAIRLACVARLEVAYKGQDLLLQALASLEIHRSRWSLTFYGAGPDEDYLRHLTAFYGLEDNVHFAGHAADIRSIWEDNHALVLSSR